MEPAIEVTGVGAGHAEDGDAGEQVPVGPVASARVSRPLGTKIAAGQLSQGHIGAGQLRPGQKMTVQAVPISANLSASEPEFDQVSRTVREITNMVPV